jgi:Fe-Mn family superoxide dismutase
MDMILSKRKFLGYLGAAPFLIAALKSTGVLPAAYAAEPVAEKTPTVTGPFKLLPLPYPKNALEKAIDAKTMEIHHGKHHQAYIDKLNKAVTEEKKLEGKSLEEILAHVSGYSDDVRNNAGGHWNHSFFWNIMTPEKTEASPELANAINTAFGSVEEFKKKFEETGAKRFGSGWVWLIVNKDKKLEIVSTPNQDNPLMDDVKIKGTPVLGNDVWEHAYYLRYQNKRADYLKNWWQVVNWKKVSEVYNNTNKT